MCQSAMRGSKIGGSERSFNFWKTPGTQQSLSPGLKLEISQWCIYVNDVLKYKVDTSNYVSRKSSLVNTK